MTDLIQTLTVLLRFLSEGAKVGLSLELLDKLSKSPPLLRAFVRVIESSGGESAPVGEQSAPQELTPAA